MWGSLCEGSDGKAKVSMQKEREGGWLGRRWGYTGKAPACPFGEGERALEPSL